MPDSFGLYIHVPFCSVRCGYCDFNTYVPGEVGSDAGPDTYLRALVSELEQATEQFDLPAADTLFFGGGTPSLLGADTLTHILDTVRSTMGLAPGAEVTTECNPESTSQRFFDTLRSGGFTRISMGMQSTAPHVLRVLQRSHTPGRALAAVHEAKAAGFDHINVDLIYGTPTETLDDLQRSVDAVLDTPVDHVSAYSLIVEPGTAMARRVATGELTPNTDDEMAQRYELVDRALRAAGMQWYEVSNWSLPGGECRHNLLYWRDGDWWGAGPGAHGKVHNTRYVNLKHPRTYAQALLGEGEATPHRQSVLPRLAVHSVEPLTPLERHEEKVLTGLRLREGMAEEELGVSTGLAAELERKISQGLLWRPEPGRVALTDEHRLLADGIIIDLLAATDE